MLFLDGIIYKYQLSLSDLMCHLRPLFSYRKFWSGWYVHWCKWGVKIPTVVVLLSIFPFMAVSIYLIYWGVQYQQLNKTNPEQLNKWIKVKKLNKGEKIKNSSLSVSLPLLQATPYRTSPVGLQDLPIGLGGLDLLCHPYLYVWSSHWNLFQELLWSALTHSSQLRCRPP